MSSSQVYCVNCDAFIPAVDINIKTMAAKCASCDHIFSIAPPANPDSRSYFDFGMGSELSGAFDGEPPRPKRILVESGPGTELYLKKRWFSPAVIALLIFGIAWDSFLVFWYSIAFTQPDTPWIMIVFPIGHLAVGVAITYTAIAGLINTTHIIADKYSISVRHRPIPWFGNKEIDFKDIRRLAVERDTYNQHDTPTQQYKIMADVDGTEVKLLSGLEPSEARYIAYQFSKQVKVDFA